MTFDVVPLIDGDVVLVATDTSDAQDAADLISTTPHERETGLLDATEVAQVLTDAVVGGLTFEALKAMAKRIASRRKTPVVPATAAEIRDGVVDYLTQSGYATIVVSEVAQVPGQGWSLEGKADARRFSAFADENGQIVYVRVR